MNIYKKLEERARKNKRTIVFPESYDDRVIKAVKIISKRNFCKIILIYTGKTLPIKDSPNVTILDLDFSSQFVRDYYNFRKLKNPELNFDTAAAEIKDPLAFAGVLVRKNYANACVAGSVYSTSDVLRRGIQILGLKRNNTTVSSFFLFTFPKNHPHSDKVLAYADCGVIPVPTAEQLSDIAIQTSLNYKKLTGFKPKTAFLAFSTAGSAKDKSLDRILEALKITREKNRRLHCEGELQFDAAFVPEVAVRKNPKGKIKGDANVFIFPDLNAGNIAYKITERVGGANAAGPIVQGLSKPWMDLSRGCSVQDIVNMSLIASTI